MAINWKQAVGDRGPGSAGFAMETARATEIYYVDQVDVPDCITDALGTTVVGNAGALNRTLPKAHPLYTWLYASELEITGFGTDDLLGTQALERAVEEDLEVPAITDTYWDFAKYQVRVVFTQRPYAVLSNDSITSEDISYYDDSGSSINTKVADEYLRYTDWTYEPSVEVAFAQQGQMVFRRGDGSAYLTPSPHLATFAQFPRIMLPKAAVVFTWYQVPFSYLESNLSNLVTLIGRINQVTWYGWAAGSLLYSAVKVLRRYTPPQPDRELWTGSTSFSTAKLCDLQIVFEETVRSATGALSTYGNNNNDIKHRGYVAEGHNLQPSLATRKFHYVTTNNSDMIPLYYSTDFRLLWTDPDVDEEG